MSAQAPTAAPAAVLPIVYPESDGKPIAENTKQFDYITTIKWGVEALFRDDPSVFIAGDLLWYPVEGHPEITTAPDTMVVFGRPKGPRRSYLQWEEGGIGPQVVFEVLSPSNTTAEMARKLEFYERHGVEEYYVYDPDRGRLRGWLREHDGELEAVESMHGWVSPRLGVRFELEDGELLLYRPDGERFASYLELVTQRERAHQLAEQERERAEQERERAEQERERAEQERRRVDRLAERLRSLGVDPDSV
jgi:Uma2 family endonuclease